MSEDAKGLFDGVLARGRAADEVSDRAWLAAMLEVEAALARSEARLGLIPPDHAEAIGRAAEAGEFDPGSIGRDAARDGNPVIPLVAVLREAVGEPAAASVHLGATSQDILDSAAMLVARRALEPLLEDLAAAADAAAGLAAAHRSTPAVARTLLQHALPTTFGARAAGWLLGLDAAADRLAEVRRSRLAVQLGGAAGTLASFGDAGPAVVAALAEELGLAEPVAPWHTERTRIAELGAALGEAAGAAGKVAADVILLAQTEVGEVREASPGGSSAMPHKRNPVAAVSAAAAACRAPGLVATLFACIVQEQERAAGAWHAEWRPLSDLVATAGSAAAWLRECLEHLDVDPARMRANLGATRGLLMAERVAGALAADLGRARAREVTERAGAAAVEQDRPLADLLAADPEVAAVLGAADLANLFDVTGYLGSAAAFVDRALAAHAARRATP